MSSYQKYLKYKAKYLELKNQLAGGSTVKLGDRVVERDSQMKGSVTKVYVKPGLGTFIVMKGDDGKEYENKVSLNFTQIGEDYYKNGKLKLGDKVKYTEHGNTGKIVFVGTNSIIMKDDGGYLFTSTPDKFQKNSWFGH